MLRPVIDFFKAYKSNLGYRIMLLVCFICFVVGALLMNGEETTLAGTKVVG